MDSVNTFFVIFGKKFSGFYVTVLAADSGFFACFPMIQALSFHRSAAGNRANASLSMLVLT